MNSLSALTNYREAETWLLSITDYERLMGSGSVRYNTRTFDLQHFADQLKQLDNPQHKYAVVHVAGTKGKGSTCALTEAALRQCGLKTGLYTSPHLERFTERIRVDGREMPEADFCRYLEKTRAMIMAGDAQPEKSFRTVFELLTASALAYFADQRVDVAVIETGLGGRLDSTNVFNGESPFPLVSVITSIGLDHTAILGETIDKIAGEKAGIIHRRSRVVVSPQASKETESIVREVVTDRCAQTGAQPPVLVRDEIAIEPTPGNLDCWNVRGLATADSKTPLAGELTHGTRLCCALQGEHQAANIATALVALRELAAVWDAARDRITLSRVAEGFATVDWPGRFQVKRIGNVDVVIDGAHCLLSAAALGRACARHFDYRPAVAITGFLRDKAGRDLVHAFASWVNVVHAIAAVPPSVRSLPGEEIASVLEAEFGADRVSSAESITEALDSALQTAQQFDNAYVVLFGSLYLIGPALTYKARA